MNECEKLLVPREIRKDESEQSAIAVLDVLDKEHWDELRRKGDGGVSVGFLGLSLGANASFEEMRQALDKYKSQHQLSSNKYASKAVLERGLDPQAYDAYVQCVLGQEGFGALFDRTLPTEATTAVLRLNWLPSRRLRDGRLRKVTLEIIGGGTNDQTLDRTFPDGGGTMSFLITKQKGAELLVVNAMGMAENTIESAAAVWFWAPTIAELRESIQVSPPAEVGADYLAVDLLDTTYWIDRNKPLPGFETQLERWVNNPSTVNARAFTFFLHGSQPGVRFVDVNSISGKVYRVSLFDGDRGNSIPGFQTTLQAWQLQISLEQNQRLERFLLASPVGVSRIH